MEPLPPKSGKMMISIGIRVPDLLVSVSQVVAWPSSRSCMLLAWGTYETLMNLFEAKVRSCRWGKTLRPLSGFNWSSLEGSKGWVFWFSRGFLMPRLDDLGRALVENVLLGFHQLVSNKHSDQVFVGDSFPGNWSIFLMNPPQTQVCGQAEGGQRFQWAKCGWPDMEISGKLNGLSHHFPLRSCRKLRTSPLKWAKP